MTDRRARVEEAKDLERSFGSRPQRAELGSESRQRRVLEPNTTTVTVHQFHQAALATTCRSRFAHDAKCPPRCQSTIRRLPPARSASADHWRYDRFSSNRQPAGSALSQQLPEESGPCLSDEGRPHEPPRVGGLGDCRTERRCPCSTTSPSSITTTLSAISATTPKSCVMNITLIPAALNVADQLQDLRLGGHVECGCRLVRDQDRGSSTRAIAIITRCRCPPESRNEY